MTEPSEAAKAKACELAMANANTTVLCLPTDNNVYQAAFARFIQQVSDAAKVASSIDGPDPEGRRYELLAPFILPEPVDPLEEVIEAVQRRPFRSTQGTAELLRAELARRNLKIVEAQ